MANTITIEDYKANPAAYLASLSHDQLVAVAVQALKGCHDVVRTINDTGGLNADSEPYADPEWLDVGFAGTECSDAFSAANITGMEIQQDDSEIV